MSTSAPEPAALQVVVSLGTDHHRFDRAVEWVDRWIDGCDQPVGLVAQVGTSARSRHGRSCDLMAPAELAAAMALAEVVVCHGGPATIVDARRAGKRPVVIPRDPALGEHVDDHQQRFARWMAAREQVTLAASEADLRDALDRAASDPLAHRCDDGPGLAGATAARFGELVDGLLG